MTHKSIVIKNIYYMLSYAFTNLSQSIFEEITKEDFDHIHNMFASILSKGIGQQIKQGMYKQYIDRSEDLSTVKGKISIQESIKLKLAKKQYLHCEFDELSENNIFNQIIKTTVLLLLKHGSVDVQYKNELKRNMLYFSHVDTLDLSLIRWSTLRFHRNNQTYRMLISICQLIVEGMLQTTQQGEFKMQSFLDEQRLHRLFEKFILEYYIKHYPKTNPRATQIPWSLDDGLGTMLPIMQSDITLSQGNKVLIIDTKFYAKTMQTQFDKQSIRSSNLYQIFTYVKNKAEQLKDFNTAVSGLVLYAKTDELIHPNHSYIMSGNKISVKTIDLNYDFPHIQRQLDQIVIDHFG
ncbi:MAG: 5-methylcytosine-specific restriction endonuclease system specificity protein McrC [Erysipelotrichia bacterium]|nr:5-methylcytosine-specific restriction endonuclease system specificity protein McrC [Erysipelotrichia bacterium]